MKTVVFNHNENQVGLNLKSYNRNIKAENETDPYITFDFERDLSDTFEEALEGLKDTIITSVEIFNEDGTSYYQLDNLNLAVSVINEHLYDGEGGITISLYCKQ